MKIEFGAGKNITKGFVACDVRPMKHIKYVCNCWEIDQHIPEGSVEEIYSRHMFEHLTFKQGRLTLKSWGSVLKTGGRIRLMMPDLKFHVKQLAAFYNNPNSRDPSLKLFKNKEPLFPGFCDAACVHGIAGFYGWQKETETSEHFTSDTDLWDVHKSGYDERSLKHLVEHIQIDPSGGYERFKRLPNKEFHLDVEFFKKEK